jgi:hypothetical protein
MLAIAIRVLEAMFVLGIIGSAVVVVLTSIEDFATLFNRDSKSASHDSPPALPHSARPFPAE